MTDLIGWTLRDVVRSPRFTSLLGSFAALLTIGSWIGGLRSPFGAIEVSASWLGIRVDKPLRSAGVWLNSPNRHNAIAIAGVVLVVLALMPQLQRMATHHAELDAIFSLEDETKKRTARSEDITWTRLSEMRFWTVAFIVMMLLAELHEISPRRALLCLFAILILRAGAAIADVIAHNKRRYPELNPLSEWPMVVFFETVFGVFWVVEGLTYLPIAMLGLIIYPRMPAESRRYDARGDS